MEGLNKEQARREEKYDIIAMSSNGFNLINIAHNKSLNRPGYNIPGTEKTKTAHPAKYRAMKDTNGTGTFGNTFLLNTELSSGAKIFYLYVLNQPETRRYTTTNLSRIFSIDLRTIRRWLKELRSAEYLEYSKLKDPLGFTIELSICK